MSLISTGDIRNWMSLPEGDKAPNAKLSYITKVVEDFCDSYTNRKLEAARYNTDPNYSYYDGNGKNFLYLKQYPVSYVASVNMDADRVFSSGTLFASGDYYFEPSGKLRLGAGSQYTWGGVGGFAYGRKNILVDYIAGYAPVVGNTWDSTVSTYPLPYDLKQVMVEMCVESVKEGMTGIHTVNGPNVVEPKFIQMLSRNSFWTNTLNRYKAFDSQFGTREE